MVVNRLARDRVKRILPGEGEQLRFDITNPHLELTFFVLAASYEGEVHGDRDRRRRFRRPDRGTVGECRASLQRMAAQGRGVDTGVDRVLRDFNTGQAR